MQSLMLDPPVPYLVPPADRVSIALVGCGGTGSHIAQSLARLASHCRDTGGPAIDLTFVDGDVVEHKNVGRQLFSPSDIGHNKAQALAARFGAVFGLSILAVPEMIQIERSAHLGRPGYGILVGAVDSAQGRTCLSQMLGRQHWHCWLDCGNHDQAGQVLVGTTADRKQLEKALPLGGGICTALPSPALVSPELLTAAAPRPREDCAAAIEDNRQSLMVNQMMAAIAGQYLYQIVIERRLTTFETIVDLSSLGMRSTPITARTLAPYIAAPVEVAA